MVKSLDFLLRSENLQLAAEKTIINSTSTAAAKDAAQRLRRIGARAGRDGERRLGVAYQLGGRPCHSVFKGRYKNFCTKTGRLRRLARVRGVGLRASRIFSAIAAGPMYGSEISPPPRSAQRRIRTEAARFAGLRIGTTSSGPPSQPVETRWRSSLGSHCSGGPGNGFCKAVNGAPPTSSDL